VRGANICRGCGASLAGMRADAQWCTEACRKAAARTAQARRSAAFWDQLGKIRLPSPCNAARARTRAKTPDKGRTQAAETDQ
jgi:hypothetical protein